MKQLNWGDFVFLATTRQRVCRHGAGFGRTRRDDMRSNSTQNDRPIGSSRCVIRTAMLITFSDRARSMQRSPSDRAPASRRVGFRLPSQPTVRPIFSAPQGGSRRRVGQPTTQSEIGNISGTSKFADALPRRTAALQRRWFSPNGDRNSTLRQFETGCITPSVRRRRKNLAVASFSANRGSAKPSQIR